MRVEVDCVKYFKSRPLSTDQTFTINHQAVVQLKLCRCCIRFHWTYSFHLVLFHQKFTCIACWLTNNWTLRNKLRWNSNRNKKIFLFMKMQLKMPVTGNLRCAHYTKHCVFQRYDVFHSQCWKYCHKLEQWFWDATCNAMLSVSR